jgi:enolase-phosphatase E1
LISIALPWIEEMHDINAILTDIEGTTTSVRFVYDVLFPYAREHLSRFLRDHADEPMVRAQMDAVCVEMGKTLDDDAIAETLINWIDEDRKLTPLKSLQGMIWEAGYRNGDFTGHLYPEVGQCLRQWHQQGYQLCVYSSGSVKAQQLLFGYSDAGDLTPLFSHYFDTRVGHKREVDSYRRIAGQIDLLARQILFLSDSCAELDAAREAGMVTMQLVRDAVSEPCDHPRVHDFTAIATNIDIQ